MVQVQAGDLVEVHYTGWKSDRTQFGCTRGGEPVRFVADGEDVIRGLSRAVLGMQQGEARTVTIEPADGFGPRLPGLTQRLPRERLSPDTRIGDRLVTRSGDAVLVLWVVGLEERVGIVDANHPLAGETLTLDLEVIGIQRPEARPTAAPTPTPTPAPAPKPTPAPPVRRPPPISQRRSHGGPPSAGRSRRR